MNFRILKHLLWGGALCCAMTFVQSCNNDVDDLQKDVDALQERVAAIRDAARNVEDQLSMFRKLTKESKKIVGCTSEENGYRIEIEDGTSYYVEAAREGRVLDIDEIVKQGLAEKDAKLKVENGYWKISKDGGKNYTDLKDADGKRVRAELNGIFTKVEVVPDGDAKLLKLTTKSGSYSLPVFEKFYLKIKGAENEVAFTFNKTLEFDVEQADVAEAVIKAENGWEVKLAEKKLRVKAPRKAEAAEGKSQIQIIITSNEGYIRVVTMDCNLVQSIANENDTQAFKEFAGKDKNNVLLDFSYAGYKRGEVAPPDVNTLGYKVYDVTQYGAVANDGKSDREALVKILKEITNNEPKVEGQGLAKALRFQPKDNKPVNAIIYFPEGEFILQGKGENNETLRLTMSNIVIKGAGKDKTTLKMDVQNEAADPAKMWSTPTMIEMKHNSGLKALTDVTADAKVGTFEVEVKSTAGIKAGSWVCLCLDKKDDKLASQELKPYTVEASMSDIKKSIRVYDYHQVRGVKGNKIIFYEPLLKNVEAKWGWKIMEYPHQENVGVEDLTFEGKAVADFIHHRSAADDGAYKPVDFIRTVNSWIRRVGFKSVSEAMSIVSSANVSAYDIEISGHRGHSAIRSQASTRVFIGKVNDHSDGYESLGDQKIGTAVIKGAGQYHACGVSKESLGAVIWRVKWGKDACFESHATQPRATLIDCCEGGFMPMRQGGYLDQMPNHLENLTIWNMNVTNVNYRGLSQNRFMWWDNRSQYFKILPPIVVGMHGVPVDFFEPQKQMIRNENFGKAVAPESLYEQQLFLRLGYVPAWLTALK